MTTTRRASARLSGGSVDDQVAQPTIASSSRTTITNTSAAADGAQRTARKRRSVEGGEVEGAVASRSLGAEVTAPAGKKRKVANEVGARRQRSNAGAPGVERPT
jgi:hypothetical protein